MQRRALSFLDIKAGIRFLDLGCGTGYAVLYVAAKCECDGMFCGVDISPRMVEIAREDSSGYRNVRFEVASADTMPLGSDFFDAILCTNSFHHYLHPSKTLAEISRVLKPGGRVCILDVTADGSLARWIDARTRKKEPEHVKFYSSTEYAKMFEAAGLKHVTTRTISPPMKVHIAER